MSNNSNDQDFETINIDMDEHRPIKRQASVNSEVDDAPAPQLSPNRKSGNGLAIVALIVAIGAVGASAYMFQQLQVSAEQASAAEKRILSLEDKLSATGEEMGNSTVALQVKVTELTNKSNELWEQMDKLWASAWRRNQQEIKTLNGQVSNVRSDTQKLLSDINKKVTDAQSGNQQLVSRIDNVNGKLNAQANDILTASISAEQASEAANQQLSKIAELNDKVLLLEKRNSNLLSKLSELEKQLKELATKTVSNQQLENPENSNPSNPQLALR